MMQLDERDKQIRRATAMTGIEPANQLEHPRGAWGDCDNDYSQEQHDRADGRAQNRDETGMGYSTSEDVATYYQSLETGTIKLTKPEED